MLANRARVYVPLSLAKHIATNDEITFPIPAGESTGAEVYIEKAYSSRAKACLYLTAIGHVTQPKLDKRDQSFVSAQVRDGNLGISSVFLHCDVIRDYFYRTQAVEDGSERTNLYQTLRIKRLSEKTWSECVQLGIPDEFDIAQISWRPNYDPFFYRELSRRARRVYLFRDEYIFEVEKAVVVETPQLGHATYVFAKPRDMHNFLARYTKTTKTHIRRNQDNIAEQLGFLCRVVHGSSRQSWLTELRERIGERPQKTATL